MEVPEYINISLHFARKYARIFVRCPRTLSVPRGSRSRKTVSFEEQIMSKDKHLTIISNWGMLGHVTRLNQSRYRKYLIDYKQQVISKYASADRC